MVDMPYSLNPHLPKVRAKAIWLVRDDHWTIRKTARYLGVYPGTVSKWLKKAPLGIGKIYAIPTNSSRPKTSPLAINKNIVKRILEIRLAHHRCAEIIHAQLARENITVSLSTVKRTLGRYNLLKKRSKWKKHHLSGERPSAEKPGNLVEIDTVHIPLDKKKRMYIFTMLDCYSRWGYASASKTLSGYMALKTVKEAKKKIPFKLKCVQSDHGPEFSSFFSQIVEGRGIKHRLIRVRKPNDNAHVERFNRTLQEDLKREIIENKYNINKLNKIIKQYMHYYNTQRLHLGLGCRTPLEVVKMFPRC